jgi:hypothetical protein
LRNRNCFDARAVFGKASHPRHGASITHSQREEPDGRRVGRSAIEATLVYVESHHWIFGLLALGYIFYLHDRALHARFDALERRVDEIRKRLAIEY